MVWDITRGDEPLIQFDGEDWGLVTDLQWNYDGSRLGTSSKDKNVRIFDPRNMDSTMVRTTPPPALCDGPGRKPRSAAQTHGVCYPPARPYIHHPSTHTRAHAHTLRRPRTRVLWRAADDQ